MKNDLLNLIEFSTIYTILNQFRLKINKNDSKSEQVDTINTITVVRFESI